MLSKVINIVVVLSFLTIITDAISMDHLMRLTQDQKNEKEMGKLTEIVRGDIETRQAAPAAPAAPAASTGLSSLISGIFSAFGTTLTPFLGPFAPVVAAVGPLLNSAFTGIFTNALSGLVGVLRSEDLPNSGYDTYLVNVPNQGSYIILAKTPETKEVPSPTPAPVVPPVAPVQTPPEANRAPTLSDLISNAIRDKELNQVGPKTPLADGAKKKPLLIPLSLLAALVGKQKSLKSYSDYELIVDEN